MKTQNTLRIFDALTNYAKFSVIYLKHLRDCIQNDPEYAYTKEHCQDILALAQKMTLGLLNGSANKDGKAIKLTCRELKINHTYKAIQAFIKS